MGSMDQKQIKIISVSLIEIHIRVRTTKYTLDYGKKNFTYEMLIVNLSSNV